MTWPRLRFTLRQLMVAVLLVAIFLALPTEPRVLLTLVAVPLVLILGPTMLAPKGQRAAVASWAMALHPFAYLTWLAAFRAFVVTRPLLPTDHGLVFTAGVEVPFFLAYMSRYYLLLLEIVIGVLIARSPSRRGLPGAFATLPIDWLATIAVLEWDPFKVADWVWD